VGAHDLFEADDVLVVEALEQFDLADGRNRKPLLLVVHAHPLERDERPVPLVAREVDLAVRPFPDLAQLGVAVLQAAAAAVRVVAGG
jgi:hypothetical protein